MNILYTENQQLRETITHESEVPFHFVFSKKPLFEVDVLIFENGPENVDKAKMVSLLEVDVLEIIVLRQHVSATSLL